MHMNLVGVSQGRKQQQVNRVESLHVELVSELVCRAHAVVLGFHTKKKSAFSGLVFFLIHDIVNVQEKKGNILFRG